MTEDEINEIARKVVSAFVRRVPSYSEVLPFVPNYTGDGESLDNAVAINLEVEELWDMIIDFWEDA